MHCKQRGFSLIELLVVIAIVALLAAVAVPSYKSYILRSKISNAMAMIRAMADEAIIQYNNNNSNFPTNLVWNGITFTAGSDVAVNWGNLANLRYDATTVSGTKMIRIQANLSGLTGIPGYVAPGATTDSTAGMIRLIVYDLGGVAIKSVCGQWFGDGQASEDLPLAYQPSGCVCNIANVWSAGTATYTAC